MSSQESHYPLATTPLLFSLLQRKHSFIGSVLILLVSYFQAQPKQADPQPLHFEVLFYQKTPFLVSLMPYSLVIPIFSTIPFQSCLLFSLPLHNSLGPDLCFLYNPLNFPGKYFPISLFSFTSNIPLSLKFISSK